VGGREDTVWRARWRCARMPQWPSWVKGAGCKSTSPCTDFFFFHRLEDIWLSHEYILYTLFSFFACSVSKLSRAIYYNLLFIPCHNYYVSSFSFFRRSGSCVLSVYEVSSPPDLSRIRTAEIFKFTLGMGELNSEPCRRVQTSNTTSWARDRGCRNSQIGVRR